MLDDFEGAALAGLADAARLYDPAAGVPFEKYAPRRIFGAVLDFARALKPKGYRRAAEWPGSVPIAATDADDRADRFHPPDGAGPVGWEEESIDAVEGLIRTLPPRPREMARRYFAGGQTMAEIAARMGCSESNVSLAIKNALAVLRDRLGVPDPGKGAVA